MLSFPASPARHTAGFWVHPLPLSVPRLSSDSFAWFPMHFPRFSVLGFLSVSFRPSLLRSHSRLTGAHLFPSFDFPEVFFLAFPFLSSGSRLGFDYSAFCFFLSLLPGFPSQWFLPVLLPSFDFRFFHLPFRMFPCFRSNFGTQLFLQFRFLFLCFASQGLHSPRPPVSSSAVPLSFRLRFKYFGRVDTP